MSASKLTIIGGGSWGTALAQHAASIGFKVTLWAREQEVADTINATHTNPLFLPDITLSPLISATTDEASALTDSALVLIVVPSQHLRVSMLNFIKFLPPTAPLVLCSKGIETSSLLTMHQVMKQILPSSAGNRLAALSGPSFAREVALGQPTNLSIAAEETETAHSVQIQLSSRTFRLYTTEDVIGVEIGGAIKNVLAIAAGAVDGLGLGHNTKAALITRGIAEMTRLALAMGGHPRTLAGLSGIGDLVLTCTGHLSRNRKIGEAIGKGEDPRTVLKHMIAEGVETSKSVHALAIKHKVDMPICTEVYQSLHEGKPIQAALESLLSRELKDEVY